MKYSQAIKNLIQAVKVHSISCECNCIGCVNLRISLQELGHDESKECWCEPDILPVKDTDIVIHNT